jgi:hypothetical protein
MIAAVLPCEWVPTVCAVVIVSCSAVLVLAWLRAAEDDEDDLRARVRIDDKSTWRREKSERGWPGHVAGLALCVFAAALAMANPVC